MSFAQFIAKHNPRPTTAPVKPKIPKVVGVFKPGDRVRVVSNHRENDIVRSVMGNTYTIKEISITGTLTFCDAYFYLFSDEVEHV